MPLRGPIRATCSASVSVDFKLRGPVATIPAEVKNEMKTKKTKAADLRDPTQEGDIVRLGSKVLLSNGVHQVVEKSITSSGYIRLVLKSVPAHKGEQLHGTLQRECGAGQLFDEVID